MDYALFHGRRRRGQAGTVETVPAPADVSREEYCSEFIAQRCRNFEFVNQRNYLNLRKYGSLYKIVVCRVSQSHIMFM